MSEWPIMHTTSEPSARLGVFDVSVRFVSVKPLELHQFLGGKRLSCKEFCHQILGLVACRRSLALSGTRTAHGSQNVLDGVQASKGHDVEAVLFVSFFL